MEEETIKVTFNSESIQLKKDAWHRCLSIGASDAWRKFRRPCQPISECKLKSSQVTLYHRLNIWSQAKHWCIRCTLFQRACLVDLNSPSAPVEPTLQNQAPVHLIYYVPESLFELISKSLQHRLNRRPYEVCTGAMTQAWILCQNPNGY